MKLTAPPARGSMGIPPEMQAEFERQRQAAKAKVAEKEVVPDTADSMGFGEEPARVDPPKEDDATPDGPTAEQLLKEIGTELTDEDMHRFIFKGYIEKDIKLSFFGGKKTLTPTFRTLTANEYDMIGELLGSELDSSTIMRDEVMVRRNMWTLAFGVVKMDGRPLAKPVMTEGVKDGKAIQKVDLKATAKLNREVLGSLAAPVVSQMILTHGKLSLALDLMTKDQGSQLLKK